MQGTQLGTARNIKSMMNHQDSRQRLNSLLPRALDRLESLLEPRDECEACGRSDDDPALVRAIENILDRTGHGRSATVTVDQSSNLASLQALDPHELLARAEGTVARLRALLYPAAEPQKLLPASEVVEGEATRVVPGEDPSPATEDPSSCTSQPEPLTPEPEPAPKTKADHIRAALMRQEEFQRQQRERATAEMMAQAGSPLPDWYRS